MPEDIHLASYLIERIKQAGVKQIFGVPGDYNLEFLDYFEKDPVLEWVGNANELNAAYAADGYARVKGGLAVLVTTFGVGELSALCGVAGSLAERLPVLHIVGAPSTKMQKQRALLHHTLNTATSFQSFPKMSEPLSCAQVLLSKINPQTNRTYADAIDQAITACVTQCRPAYIELPMDCVRSLVSPASLQKPLPTPRSAPPVDYIETEELSYAANNTLSQNNVDDHFDMPSEKVIDHIVALVTERFRKAERPVVLVDACASRFGVGPLVRHMVEACGIRAFTMGKGILNERSELFGGCYAGANSLKPVIKELEASDFVLYVGALKSDFNSGGFSVKIPTERTVRLHSFTTNVGYASFPTTDIRHVLPKLVPAFEKVAGEHKVPVIRDTLEQKMKTGLVEQLTSDIDGREIVHAWFWRRLGSWFKEQDIIITETGTSSFGLLSVPMPSHVDYVSQILWGAIGWSVGATLGCALAAEEADEKRRTILFVGDGSLQLTLQEIGTMIRRGLKPYLFVLNNDGYEIERQIHGMNAEYNNIQPYRHQLMLPFLGGGKDEEKLESHEVRTQDELQALLTDPAFAVPDRIRMIEVYMPRGDAPRALLVQAKLTAEANAE